MGHRGVGVDGVRDPEALRATRRVHPLRALRAHREGVVLVAPVVEVVGEEVRADPESGHAAEVGVVGHLAVLEGEARIRVGSSSFSTFSIASTAASVAWSPFVWMCTWSPARW